ncbi:hypothetical protein BC567DRAFT_266777 [Phyllosticta citribraziliensis]
MSESDHLDLVAALLTNLRNAKATLGEDSPRYRELKAMVDDHIANAAIASSEPKSTEQSTPDQNQQTNSFNLAFRPRRQGSGFGQ